MFRSLVLLWLLVLSVVKGSKVVELTGSNFHSELKNHPLALVKFYAPWCGHCKALAPEYIKASEKLASLKSSVLLTEVDCTQHTAICEENGISGYPSLKIFRHGEFDTEYSGPRVSDGIVDFLLKRSAPPSTEVNSIEEIENQRHFDVPTIVAYFKSQNDDFKETFVKLGSEMLDNALFMHTHANVFSTNEERFIRLYIPKKLNSPLETTNFDYTGKFDSAEVKKWIQNNGLGIFGHRTAKTEFYYPDSDMLLIFHNISFEDDPAGIKYFRNRVVKALKKSDITNMKVAYCHTQDQMSEWKTFNHDVVPAAAIRTHDKKKYKMESFSFDGIPEFVKKFKNNELAVFVVSDPIPADDNEPLKTVVGLTFDKIVNDPTKDVLVMLHAEWCGHCRNLMPKFEEAAQKLANEPGVVLARMEATRNDVPEPYKVHGYPTLYFSPMSDKKKPVPYNGGREVNDIIAYIAKHSTNELVGFDRNGSPKKSEL